LVATGAFMAAVNINNMKSFCMFYDEIHTTVKIHSGTKRLLHLPGNAKLIKNRRVVAMMIGNDVLLFRGYFLYICFGLIKDVFIIYSYFIKIFVEQIS